MTDTDSAAVRRRRFLKTMVAASAGAVAVDAVAQEKTAAVATPESPREADDGYRETAHVKRYYDTTRL